MKKTIYRIPKFMTVSEIRRDQFRVVVPFCFDDSSMILVSSRTEDSEDHQMSEYETRFVQVDDVQV
jgi:hypothetical protein